MGQKPESRGFFRSVYVGRRVTIAAPKPGEKPSERATPVAVTGELYGRFNLKKDFATDEILPILGLKPFTGEKVGGIEGLPCLDLGTIAVAKRLNFVIPARFSIKPVDASKKHPLYGSLFEVTTCVSSEFSLSPETYEKEFVGKKFSLKNGETTFMYIYVVGSFHFAKTLRTKLSS